MKKSGALHAPLSNLDLFELVTLKGDGLRAEPWNRTTPYELEVHRALFTLVPLIKGGEAEVVRSSHTLPSVVSVTDG